MARKKVEINPICGDRLKQICREQGITQLQLSNMIHLSQQGVSAIVNHHASLTGEMASRVIDVFPQYRIEWLLGYDDAPTSDDVQAHKNMMKLKAHMITASYNQGILNNLLGIIDNEARHNDGIDINVIQPLTVVQMHEQGLISDEEWEGWTHGGNQSEHMKALAAEHSDYVVTIDGESINIPVRDFFLLADDIDQYALFRMKEYMKNKKRRYY